MALGNPLTAEEFADLLLVNDVTLVQGYQQQRSATGGGDIGYSDRGVSLWQAKIRTIELDFAAAASVMAKIDSRGGGLKTALLYDYKLPYPPSDPTGSILGVSTPTIKTITDRLHIVVQGLPVGYPILSGTRFGLIFDTSRYYLGRFVEDVTAGGTGETGSVEISPPLPASVVTDLAVNLVKPPAKFTIKPNTAYPSSAGTLYETIEFSAEQTYRA